MHLLQVVKLGEVPTTKRMSISEGFGISDCVVVICWYPILATVLHRILWASLETDILGHPESSSVQWISKWKKD